MLRYADVTITVVTPRSFEIVVSGEVERPGTLSVTALRRVHDVILDAGGITPRGSTRRVLVTRKRDRERRRPARFQMRGDLTQNPLVEEGTKIHVPPRGHRHAHGRGPPAGRVRARADARCAACSS